jgi:hypothetical protein
MHFVSLVKRQVSLPPGAYFYSEAKRNVNVHTYIQQQHNSLHIHTNTI